MCRNFDFPPDFVVDGDSITLGDYDSVDPYPSIISGDLAVAGKPFSVLNHGCNSIGFSTSSNDCGSTSIVPDNGTLISNAAQGIDWIIAKKPNARLIIFGGTNDIWIGGLTGAQTCSAAETYIAARETAGWAANQMEFVTMLPRYNNAFTPAVNAALETERQNYISCIVSYATTNGIALARLDQDSTIGQAGDEMNTTYYEPDMIHPTQAGLNIAAPIIYGDYP